MKNIFRSSLKVIVILSLLGTMFLNFNNASASYQSNGIKFLSRTMWGANEALRLFNKNNPLPQLANIPPDFYVKYAQELKLIKIVKTNENGDKITWPLQYPKEVSKIIIHHTASNNDLDNPIKVIRNLYSYHTITRGWGDMGYNYVIDKNGKVYEGRYGGETIVGAHAGPGNRGSIGIALMGNFNETEVPKEALDSLIKLIAEKAQLYDIDPTGVSLFRDEMQPNIMGHKHVMNTSCPGENLEKLLPTIRSEAAKLVGTTEIRNYAYEIVDIYYPKSPLNPGEKTLGIVKLKNIGSKVWQSYGKNRISLGSDNPQDRFSGFTDSTRMGYLKELFIEPGEIGHFVFNLKAPEKVGLYEEYFTPVVEGITWLNGKSMNFKISVT